MIIRTKNNVWVYACAVACSSYDDAARQTSALTASDAVQAYIDANFYSDAEIRHTFHTAAGERIDCIDFEAQRSVQAFRKAGVAIDPIHIPATPTPPTTIPRAYKPNGVSIAFDGSLDADGATRLCAAGTVPTSRPTVKQITALGGVTEFKSQRMPLPLDPNQDALQHDCFHQQNPGRNFIHTAGVQVPQVTFNGALTYLSVHAPQVFNTTAEHSLGQQWVQANECEDWNDPYGDVNTCTPGGGPTKNPVQSLEVGWMVGNGGSTLAGAHAVDPYLFVFITQDGYNIANCFAKGQGNGGNPGACCPSPVSGEGTDCWVAAPGAPFVPGQDLAAYVQPAGHAPAELAVQVWNGGNAWYVYVDGSLIGWYPTSGPAGSVAFTGTMATSATYLQAGGEVFDSFPNNQHTTTSLGSAYDAHYGFTWAAYVRDVSYIIGTTYTNASFGYVSDVFPSQPGLCGFNGGTHLQQPWDYSLSWTAPAGGQNWNTYFYYGGSPFF